MGSKNQELQDLFSTHVSLFHQVRIFDQSSQQKGVLFQNNQQFAVLLQHIKIILKTTLDDGGTPQGNSVSYEDCLNTFLKSQKAIEDQLSAFEYFSEENLHVRFLCSNIRLVLNEQRESVKRLKTKYNYNNCEHYEQNQEEEIEVEAIAENNSEAVGSAPCPPNNSAPYKAGIRLNPQNVTTVLPTVTPYKSRSNEQNVFQSRDSNLQTASSTGNSVAIDQQPRFDDLLVLTASEARAVSDLQNLMLEKEEEEVFGSDSVFNIAFDRGRDRGLDDCGYFKPLTGDDAWRTWGI